MFENGSAVDEGIFSDDNAVAEGAVALKTDIVAEHDGRFNGTVLFDGDVHSCVDAVFRRVPGESVGGGRGKQGKVEVEILFE